MTKEEYVDLLAKIGGGDPIRISSRLEANAPIVAKRLRQAGVRLATMLNTTLGK
jgi:hypothetical protein